MTQPISEDDVRHVALLSRLNVDDADVARFAKQLGDVLAYIDKLSEVDVQGVAPMAHALDTCDVTRDDQPGATLDCETALRNAPQSDPPFFAVPKVLGSESGA